MIWVGTVPLGSAFTFRFVTASSTTAAATYADVVPFLKVMEDSSDVAMLTPAVVTVTTDIGEYRAIITVSTTSGFEVSKSYAVVIHATVGSIFGKSVKTIFLVGPPTKYAAVVTDAGNAVGSFKTDLLEAVTDFHKDTLIRFVTGDLAGQVKKCTAYNGTTKFINVSPAYTGIPTTGDIFRIVSD